MVVVVQAGKDIGNISNALFPHSLVAYTETFPLAPPEGILTVMLVAASLNIETPGGTDHTRPVAPGGILVTEYVYILFGQSSTIVSVIGLGSNGIPHSLFVEHATDPPTTVTPSGANADP